jgi:hypothetical protein
MPSKQTLPMAINKLIMGFLGHVRKKIKIIQTNYWSIPMANGWTLERKARQAVLIQSWQPWNKSTGARTPEGKAVSSRNAHKGGIRSICKNMNILFRDYKDMMKRFD